MRLRVPCVAVCLAVPFFAGCPDSGIGDSCSSAVACPNGLACDTALPGGYCTQPCSTLGNTDQCLGTPDLSDAVCSSFDGGLICAGGCGAAAPCRSGYTCRPIAGGAGPASTGGVCLP